MKERKEGTEEDPSVPRLSGNAGMRSVTEGFVRRVLAGAPGHFPVGFDLDLKRGLAGVFPAMGSVAKRLSLGLTTGTPVICTGFFIPDYRGKTSHHSSFIFSSLIDSSDG